MGRGKQGGKWHFPLFSCGKKTRETKIWGKIFPPSPPFFILPIWEENEEGKVLKDTLYTNTLSLSCIFSFLLSSLGSNVALFFFFGNNVTSNIALFFFFFLGNHVASCHFFFFFFFFLGINIASFFFLIFFSFDFLGLGHDSLFLFLLDVIFFWNMFFIVVICHFFL